MPQGTVCEYSVQMTAVKAATARYLTWITRVAAIKRQTGAGHGC